MTISPQGYKRLALGEVCSGLVDTRSRKQAAEGCADVMASTQPPGGFGLRSFLPLTLLSSAQVGWVAGEDSVGNYCILMHGSDFSLVSELPGAVVDDTMKYNEWTCGN